MVHYAAHGPKGSPCPEKHEPATEFMLGFLKHAV